MNPLPIDMPPDADTPERLFMHSPRAPIVPAGYPNQRWFAPAGGPRSVRLADCSLLMLHANAGEAEAILGVDGGSESVAVSCRVRLAPAALRELARCCIDAAAALEADAARADAKGPAEAAALPKGAQP